MRNRAPRRKPSWWSESRAAARQSRCTTPPSEPRTTTRASAGPCRWSRSGPCRGASLRRQLRAPAGSRRTGTVRRPRRQPSRRRSRSGRSANLRRSERCPTAAGRSSTSRRACAGARRRRPAGRSGPARFRRRRAIRGAARSIPASPGGMSEPSFRSPRPLRLRRAVSPRRNTRLLSRARPGHGADSRR